MANKEKQEYDYEGDMAMSQLKSIIANAQRMHDMLKVDTNLPEWVQSKITLAEDYISTASNYLQGEMKEDVDSYADALIKRNKQNLNKGHVVNAARIAGMDGKKLMAAVNKKVGRIKEEVAHSVHVKTYDSQGEKQMNSPEFKNHVSAHGGKLDYASDKGAAFKFASHSHAAAFHRGVQSKFRELDSEHDMHEEKLPFKGPYKKVGPRRDEYGNVVKNVPKHLAKKAMKDLTKEEVAVNAAGAGNVAGIGVGPQGEPGVHMKKKKKVVLASFKRFAKK